MKVLIIRTAEINPRDAQNCNASCKFLQGARCELFGVRLLPTTTLGVHRRTRDCKQSERQTKRYAKTFARLLNPEEATSPPE